MTDETESAAGRHSGPAVCLVSMPYAQLQLPSLALGLLQGILGRAGVNATVIPANLWFAERVGVRLYELCSRFAPTEFLMGEWSFAAAAFPDARDRDEEYLRWLAAETATSPLYDDEGGERLVMDLRSLQAAATQFIDVAARRVLATGARVVGCTSTFEQHVASLALLRRIRELDPDVITMLGGANCETVMGLTTHRCFHWIDYVVSGEADGLIADLCKLTLSRGRDVTPGELPPGVLGPCHRDGVDGQAAGRAVPTRALFRDLDSLPSPRFDDYFNALAASPLRTSIKPGLPLETSRGCWWGDRHQCTFCGLNGSSLAFRSKSPDRVLTELRGLEERYGITNFEFVDNILDMTYFTTLLPSLAGDGTQRQLFYEVKANLSRKQVESLVRAGVTWVQPGIESLHTEVLRLMDKGVRGWQNIQLLKWAREFGLRLSWSLLWGFPGESDEYYVQMARWLPALEHLQAPSGLIRLRYDRFSVYHERAQQMGLLLFPIRAMSYVYPVCPADLDGLSYFFTTEPGRALIQERKGRTDHRPGVQAVREATQCWKTEFGTGLPPVLSSTDLDGELDIVDTRRCARASRFTLRGLARTVCLACDDAPRADQLAEILRRDHGLPASDDQVADAVDQLVSDLLVLPIDGRLVSLIVRNHLPRLPDKTDFPGGYVYQNETDASLLAIRQQAGAGSR